MAHELVIKRPNGQVLCVKLLRERHVDVTVGTLVVRDGELRLLPSVSSGLSGILIGDLEFSLRKIARDPFV